MNLYLTLCVCVCVCVCCVCVPWCVQDQQCGFNMSGVAADCKGYKQIPVGNERALAVALFKAGPVSVGIDATLGTFQFYQRGQLPALSRQLGTLGKPDLRLVM